VSSESKPRPAAKPNLGPKAGPANRRALIEAAREVFHDEGFGAPLSAVARRAGVGQGSLYRHFPDRMSLGIAVFDENITELEELAARPDATLDDLLVRIAEQAIGSTAILDMITSDITDERAAHLGERVAAVAAELRDREVHAGRLAAHVSAEDVMLAIGMLALVLARTPEDSRERVSAQARAIFHTAFAPTAAGAESAAGG
jgi:AcrR family transcriptional regulator